MLPAIIFDSLHSSRMQMADFLGDYIRNTGSRISIVDNTASEEGAQRSIQNEEGVLLLILGMDADDVGASVRLEHMAAQQNRDTYALYWLRDVGVLPALASACLRPVGFILPPPDRNHFNGILNRVMEDYASFRREETDQYLTLQMGGNLRRLRVQEIEYLEALDKKVNIYTHRQCISVYDRLNRLEQVLKKGFVRCHRSILVNFSQIESVDFATMEVRLTGGARVPLSRSRRDELRERIAREGLCHES